MSQARLCLVEFLLMEAAVAVGILALLSTAHPWTTQTTLTGLQSQDHPIQKFQKPAVDREWILKLPKGVQKGTDPNVCCYSQSYQDVIIRDVFSVIGETNRYFVEFGFNTKTIEGFSGPNTAALHFRGWKGLRLDGANENLSINLHAHFLYSNNIAYLFQHYGVPKELDYLSVDIDGFDVFVTRALLLAGFRPRLVSTEYNPNFGGLPAAISVLDPTLETGELPPNWKFFYYRHKCVFGASPAAINLVMKEFGYSLIAVVPRLDLFWLRDDLVLGADLPSWNLIGKPNKLHFSLVPGDEGLLKSLIDVKTYLDTKNVTLAVETAKTTVCNTGLPCFAKVCTRP